MSGRKLLFFCSNNSFGNGFMWKTTEIIQLSKVFDTIHVYPLENDSPNIWNNKPENVQFHIPLLDENAENQDYLNLSFLFSIKVLFYLKEFFRERVYCKRYWLKSWSQKSGYIRKLIGSDQFKSISSIKSNENTYLYFYWGFGWGFAIPFFAEAGFNNIYLRLHGYDFYKERLGGYQPYKFDQIKNSKRIILISVAAKRYFFENYNYQSDFDQKIIISRLGTVGRGLARPSEDGIFRIYSCSSVIGLKRVSLILDALKLIRDFPIEYMHIGDGPLLEDLQNAAMVIPGNLKVELRGRIENQKILDEYVNKPIDLFINASTTEGVPVSVMEALSAGIPVMATDVGGTGELISEDNGLLIPPDLNKEKLAEYIVAFKKLPQIDILLKRENAFKKYKEKADLEYNSKRLAEFFRNDQLLIEKE